MSLVPIDYNFPEYYPNSLRRIWDRWLTDYDFKDFHRQMFREWDKMLSKYWPEDFSIREIFEPGPIVDSNGFHVDVDVKNFKPYEVTVKTIGNTVVVEGNHEEKYNPNNYISRKFVKKYTLPYGYDPYRVNSTMSSDGILRIEAPKPYKPLTYGQRTIPVQHVGPRITEVK